MASFYPYLVASLPMLHLGTKPPFSTERFLEIAAQFIPEQDLEALRNLPPVQAYATQGPHPAVVKWLEFDTGLRNELTRQRATRKHLSAQDYLWPEAFVEQQILHTAHAAFRNPDILNAELSLDAARWKALDEISCGHYFDLHYLVAYAYKLKILERWDKIRVASAQKLVEEAISL